MAEGKHVAYYRVSTDRQGASGLGLDAQKKAVLDFLDGGRWKLVGEYVEVESGRRSDRPKLAEAIKAAKKHKARLVFARLDRLARSVSFISGLMESKIDFVACDLPSATPFMLHIYAAVAEEEARKISERTRLALQAAKARGRKLGGPDPLGAAARAGEVHRQTADTFAANTLPIVRQLQDSGVTTLKGLAQALNARGIRTAKGGQWHPTTVKNLLARA